MKLSELVAYRDKLRKHDIDTFKSMNTQIFDLLQAEIEDPDYLALFTDHRDDIMRSLDKFKSDHLDYDHALTQRIHEQEKEYLLDSEARWNEWYNTEDDEVKLNRKLDISVDTREYLNNRIKSYTFWDQPGLQICPSHGDLTEAMVSADPLYLVDFSQDLNQVAMSKFGSKYIARLRPYVLPKSEENNLIFEQLPREQFGIIVAYNFFDNLSMNQAQRMLHETFDLLKPGGKMIFTFNDCDLPHNITLVERGFKYYTPGRLIQHHLENIGFTVIKHFRESYGMAWFEVEKPGQLERVKGSQTLAQVVKK